jgi:hypothetical protein
MRYEKFQPSSRLVRLLVLASGLGSSPIACKLKTYPVDRMPKYQALSYAWGDPTQEGTIIVNDRPFAVARNLLEASQSLRHGQALVTLWIDAICLYVDRYQRKYHRNLRFGPLFSEGFRLARRIRILSVFVSPYLFFCHDPCIFALKCTNSTFRRLYPESKIKLFPAISIPLINVNPN